MQSAFVNKINNLLIIEKGEQKMNAENITLGTWFGESREERTDDASYLYLKCLNGIKIKREGKVILSSKRREVFSNPPTKEVHEIREILDAIKLELIPCENFITTCFVTVKVSKPTYIRQTMAGFESEWLIVRGEIKLGLIEEHGSFDNRNTDITIAIPRDSN